MITYRITIKKIDQSSIKMVRVRAISYDIAKKLAIDKYPEYVLW